MKNSKMSVKKQFTEIQKQLVKITTLLESKVPFSKENEYVAIGMLQDPKTKKYYMLEVAPNDLEKQIWKSDQESWPTMLELLFMYQNKAVIPNLNFDGWYWSSTENYDSNAWILRFSDGTQGGIVKSNAGLVRCVKRVF